MFYKLLSLKGSRDEKTRTKFADLRQEMFGTEANQLSKEEEKLYSLIRAGKLSKIFGKL